MPGAVKTLAKIDPDIVLTHGEPWYLHTAWIQLACEALSIPHVYFTWENLLHVPRRQIQRTTEKVLETRVEGVIAGSETAANRIRNRGFSGNVTVAPETGVNTDMFAPAREPPAELTTEFGISDDSDIVLYAGRLTSEKGIDDILDAAPQVSENVNSAHFLLLGDGPLIGHIRERIENESLCDFVTLITERQPYNQMPNIHALASVFVYPSRTTEEWVEQFGYSAAEAMSTGVPVITTDSGSLPYVVGDGGIICPENAPDSLAENITALLRDDDRRERLGERARSRVVSEFSLESVAASHIQALEEVVTQKDTK